jgi:hypothetical protein
MTTLEFVWDGTAENQKSIRQRNSLCRLQIGEYGEKWHYKKNLKKGIVQYFIKDKKTATILALT